MIAAADLLRCGRSDLTVSLQVIVEALAGLPTVGDSSFVFGPVGSRPRNIPQASSSGKFSQACQDVLIQTSGIVDLVDGRWNKIAKVFGRLSRFMLFMNALNPASSIMLANVCWLGNLRMLSARY